MKDVQAYSLSPFCWVHYRTMGEGPWLLMVHQAAQSSEEYNAVIPILAQTFRVLAIDPPGHGQSGDPDHELEMDEYSSTALGVMDELSIERTYVFGHHGGVAICLDLAVNHADRVEKVVLCGDGVPEQEFIDRLKNTPMTRDLPIDDEGSFLTATWEVYRKMSAPETPPEVTFLPFVVSMGARQRPYDMHYAVLRWGKIKELNERLDKPSLLLRGAA